MISPAFVRILLSTDELNGVNTDDVHDESNLVSISACNEDVTLSNAADNSVSVRNQLQEMR